jgi:hypothetical protein
VVTYSVKCATSPKTVLYVIFAALETTTSPAYEGTIGMGEMPAASLIGVMKELGISVNP